MTSRFIDLADLRQIGWHKGRPLYETLAPLRYTSVALNETVIIPAGFVTDLASVPRLPLAWWLAGGRGTRSAVLHDFPYQFGFWRLTDGRSLPVDKPTVDEVFHESLIADPISGAGSTMAWAMYQGVRWGGRGIWASEERVARLNPIWSLEAP